MSFLSFIWFLSLSAIIVILFIANKISSRISSSLSYSNIHLSDVAWREIIQIKKDVMEFLHFAKPHGVRTVKKGVLIGKRAQDMFITRVYGMIEAPKGKASSFFLKHISLHKEENKKEREGE